MITEKEKIKGKRKKKVNTLEVESNVRGIFGSSFHELLPQSHLVFSPSFWGELFVGPRRKHLCPTIYFPSSLPNQKHFINVFYFHFSFKIFYPPYFNSKQTHPYCYRRSSSFRNFFMVSPRNLNYMKSNKEIT